MKRLTILGAGGFGREVLDWARAAAAHGREWVVRGFRDDNPHALDGFRVDAPLLGPIAGHAPEPGEVFVCAMGRIEWKRRVVEALRARGAEFATVVHPTAVVSPRAVLGAGVILCPHTVVAAEAVLGDFVAVNLHSTVAHDARVGEYSQIHCHADVTGRVVLGARVLVGSHASILPGFRVGDDAVVGAGAVVMTDVAAGVTVFGAPARPYAAREGSR